MLTIKQPPTPVNVVLKDMTRLSVTHFQPVKEYIQDLIVEEEYSGLSLGATIHTARVLEKQLTLNTLPL